MLFLLGHRNAGAQRGLTPEQEPLLGAALPGADGFSCRKFPLSPLEMNFS